MGKGWDGGEGSVRVVVGWGGVKVGGKGRSGEGGKHR